MTSIFTAINDFLQNYVDMDPPPEGRLGMTSALKNNNMLIHHNTPIYIAYSGGLDSHVLLHALSQLKKHHRFPQPLYAIHVNHQLSPHADDWQAHCQKNCDALKVPLHIETISVDMDKGESLEAVAREKRYGVFKKYLKQGASLMTAHHQNDQAETVLLQLMRGAGVKGLSAMPAIKPLGEGFLCRPFLNVTREALHDYAKQYALQWSEDESNQCLSRHRNVMRHQVLPLLEQTWPSCVKTIARSARLCAEAEEMLSDTLSFATPASSSAASTSFPADLTSSSAASTSSPAKAGDPHARCALTPEGRLDPAVKPRDDNSSTASSSAASTSSPAKAGDPRARCALTPEGRLNLSVTYRDNRNLIQQKHVLRQWFHQQGYPMPSEKQCEVMVREVMWAKPDATPIVCWGELALRRFNNQLYVMPALSSHDATIRLLWDLNVPLEMPSLSRTLQATKITCKDSQALCFNGDIAEVEVRFRQGGEVCYLPGRQGKKTLKNLMQVWQIPPWERDRIPLLYVNDHLAMIVGYAVCEGFEAEVGTEAWSFS